MTKSPSSRVSIGLLHYPVYDKNRQIVTTAVTNLDIHDIARSARTYGLFSYYIITPAVEQQALTGRILSHWLEGWGASYNPKRRAALELVRLADDLHQALSVLAHDFGRPPKLVVTGAQGRPGNVGYNEMSRIVTATDDAFLLLFGTGWGMTEEIFSMADFVLEPVRGPVPYNHLSVRSAAAIILDRLFGERAGS